MIANDNETVASAFKSISTIDLKPIRTKLLDPEHGLGLEVDCIDRAENLYRCFLALILAFPDSDPPIVPPTIADTFWHQHILDTRKYAADCERVFGGFLHHFPYFGMRGPEDANDLRAAGQSTERLLSHYFGYEGVDLAKCGKCSSCRSAFSST